MATEKVSSAAAEDVCEVCLDGREAALVRRMLILGLSCYGQLEKLINAAELAECVGAEIPTGLRPLHPSALADSVEKFAEALQCVQPQAVA